MCLGQRKTDTGGESWSSHHLRPSGMTMDHGNVYDDDDDDFAQ